MDSEDILLGVKVNFKNNNLLLYRMSDEVELYVLAGCFIIGGVLIISGLMML